MNWRIFLAWTILIFTTQASAGEQEEIAAVHSAISRLVPGVALSDVAPAPAEGLYEVVVGLDLLYMTADGKYIVPRLMETHTQKDVAEPKQAQLRKAFLAKVADDQVIIFKPEKFKHSVTVFTDIDCAYCRKLHNEVGKYRDKGIEVRYMFFPRSGPDTPSYYKAVSVWCAEDQQKALTEAKAGVSLPRKDCKNPINEHMRIAGDMGVRGTPMIVLDDGRIVRGYVPVNRLEKMFEESGG